MSKRASWVALIALGLLALPVGCGDDDDDDSNEGGDGDGGDGDGDGDQTRDDDHGDGGDGDGGDGDTDNVAACNDWKNAVSCTGADLTVLNMLDCSMYDSYACDLSAYFDCLSDNTSCNGSVLDITGWTNCYNLVACQ